MFKRKIAWLLIVAMLLTQSGFTIFANSTELTHEETVEEITKLGVGANAESGVGANVYGAREEEPEDVESNVDPGVGANTESGVELNVDPGVGANVYGALDEESEDVEDETTGARNDEEGSIEIIDDEEHETEITDIETEKWSNTDTATVKYIGRTGGLFDDTDIDDYPSIYAYYPTKWYIDGVETEAWLPDEMLEDSGEPSYSDVYEFKTTEDTKQFSEAPYTIMGDNSKTYAFYSDTVKKYLVLLGWTKDQDNANPFKEANSKPDYYPGVQYTGVFNDDASRPTKLYPVFKIMANLPSSGGDGGEPEYEHDGKKVTIEFWQGYGYTSEEKENDNNPEVYGPLAYTRSYMKVKTDAFPEGKEIKNVYQPGDAGDDDQFWSWTSSMYDEDRVTEPQKERTHFQIITGAVSDKKFSATIPGGNPAYKYIGNFSNNMGKELIGFAPERNASTAKYLLGETYNNILDDATYTDWDGYLVKLFPVFKSDGGGGSENNHKFIFNMDNRFASFKGGKTFEYDVNTEDKDFYIPTEDDMDFNDGTNPWQSNWMLWGWSKVQHDYHLGGDITLDKVEEFTNLQYYTDGLNNDLDEKFKNPVEHSKIRGEFKGFKDTLVETTEDINYYPLFVKRPRLRFEIRDKVEFNNNFSGSSQNLATINGGSNGGQYIEYKYGDPNTEIPSIIYDTDKYVVFDNQWSNYWFGKYYNERIVDGKKRPLTTIRRYNDMNKLVEMWKTQTYEDEKFPMNDNYNNVAWLSISLDINKVFTDEEGYDESKFEPTSTPLRTQKFFSYWPMIFDKDKVINLKLDKNDEGHKYATIDDNLPWRPASTMLEVRVVKDWYETSENNLESFYVNDEYEAGGGPYIYYISSPSILFAVEDHTNYDFRYYAFMEPKPGQFDNNSPEYKNYVYAYDAAGDKAYNTNTIDFGVDLEIDDHQGQHIAKYYKRINNSTLTMKLVWDPYTIEPKWKFIDADTNEVISTETPSKYNSSYHFFGMNANNYIASISQIAVMLYEYTAAGANDKNNGMTDLQLSEVKLDTNAIKDGNIVLVKPNLEIYLTRKFTEYPSIRFEVDENGIASPSVTGEKSFKSTKNKSEVIPPTVTSNDPKYIFDTWVDDSGTAVTTAEIQDRFEDWASKNPTDDIIFYPRFRESKVLTYIIDEKYATIDPAAKLKYNSQDVGSIVDPKFERKTGYRFSKWVDKNKNVVDGTTWDGLADLDVYAEFEKIRTITFKIDDAYHDETQVTSADHKKRVYDEDDELLSIIPPKVYPKTGYKGDGWANEEDLTPFANADELTEFIDKWKKNGTSDVSVIYIFSEDTTIAKIKFEVDSSKGEFIGSSTFFTTVSDFDAEKGNILVNPKTGYMFIGWENVDDSSDTYMRAVDISWNGTDTVTYFATFTVVNPNPSPTPNPNPNNNKPSNNDSGSTSGGGSDSGGSTTPPSGFNPNTNNPQQNNQQEMSVEEKLANSPDSKFIIVNMNKYNPNYKDSDSGHSNDSGQNFLWETTDRVIWRLIQMDNILENVDYRKTPEWDVVKSFFTQNCKFYDDGWCFLQYRGTNEWYHFAPNNIMDVGWFTKDGNIYYLQTDYNTTFGSMYTGIRDIDGVRYQFGKDGKLQGVLGFTAQFTNK